MLGLKIFVRVQTFRQALLAQCATPATLFEKYLVFKYLKATLVILYNLKILLIPLFIRFNVKLVFRKRKRGITTGRYFHQKGIFVTNLHFPHIQTPDPGHSSDIKICQQIFCEGNIILYTKIGKYGTLLIPDICHLFTLTHFKSWKFYTRKVRKITTNLPKNSNFLVFLELVYNQPKILHSRRS